MGRKRAPGIEYGYDAASRQTTVTYATEWDDDDPPAVTSTMEREWVYDLASRVVGVKANSTPVATYAYNKASQRTEASYPGFGHTMWEYNEHNGQLEKITHSNWNGGGQPTPMCSLEYSYNTDGLRTKMETLEGDWTDYGYDALNRLTSEERESGCLGLDGLDDGVYRTVSNGDALDFSGASAITLECWVKMLNVDSGSDFGIMCLGQHQEHGIIRCLPNRKLQATVTTTAGWRQALSADNVVPDDEVWHHVALSWSASDGVLRLFLDGVCVADRA